VQLANLSWAALDERSWPGTTEVEAKPVPRGKGSDSQVRLTLMRTPRCCVSVGFAEADQFSLRVGAQRAIVE
jgi:hypothetical protein